MEGKFFGIESLLESIIERIKGIAQGQLTVGDPVKQGEKTILPINTISFGLGGYGGDTWGKGSSELSQTDAEANLGFGGVGGGVRVETQGFLVMNGDDVQILPVPNRSALSGLFDRLPEMMEQVTSKLPEGGKSRIALLEEKIRAQESEIAQLSGKKKS